MKVWIVTIATKKIETIRMDDIIVRAPTLLHAWIRAAKAQKKYYPGGEITNIVRV